MNLQQRNAHWLFLILFPFLLLSCKNSEDEDDAPIEQDDWALLIQGTYFGEATFIDPDTGNPAKDSGTIPIFRSAANQIAFQISSLYQTQYNTQTSFLSGGEQIVPLDFEDYSFDAITINGDTITVQVLGMETSIHGKSLDGAFNVSTEEIEFHFNVILGNDPNPFSFKGVKQSTPASIRKKAWEVLPEGYRSID